MLEGHWLRELQQSVLNLSAQVKTYQYSISSNGKASHYSTASHVLGPEPLQSKVYISPLLVVLCVYVCLFGWEGQKKGQGQSKEIVPLFYDVPFFVA